LSSFVHISEASTIALHSLALISRTREKLNASRLAEITMFSKHHLAKVLHVLVKHNYLSSLRGPNGGFELSKDPGKISLLEVYELMEGQLETFQCAVTCKKCYFDVCIFGNHPHRFSNEFRAYLKEKNINDFTIKQSV
jgi:Rrf2 family protein